MLLLAKLSENKYHDATREGQFIVEFFCSKRSLKFATKGLNYALIELSNDFNCIFPDTD